LGENKDEEEAFMIRKIGQEGIDLLKARARYTVKIDRELIKLYLEKRIEEL